MRIDSPLETWAYVQSKGASSKALRAALLAGRVQGLPRAPHAPLRPPPLSAHFLVWNLVLRDHLCGPLGLAVPYEAIERCHSGLRRPCSQWARRPVGKLNRPQTQNRR